MMLGCFWQKTLQVENTTSNKVRLSGGAGGRNEPRFLQRGVDISRLSFSKFAKNVERIILKLELLAIYYLPICIVQINIKVRFGGPTKITAL